MLAGIEAAPEVLDCEIVLKFRIGLETILNYFDNRSTNASAESFNAKVKAFRAQFRGVKDIPFFIFRLAKIFA